MASAAAPGRRVAKLQPGSGGSVKTVQKATGGSGAEVASAPAAAEGSGLGERGDAAVLVLRAMLGPRGSSEQFIAKIRQWREQNPAMDYAARGSEAEEAGEAGGEAQVPATDNGIIVAARVRPVLHNGPDAGSLKAGDFEAVTVLASGSEVAVHTCGVHRDGISANVDHKAFSLHAAFGGKCDEGMVFETIMAPLVETAVQHKTHATALCYGQTGCGKTHTQGNLADRTAEHLFERLGARQVALEAFELTGSTAYSLQHDAKPELTLFEGRDGVVHVGGGREAGSSSSSHGALPELCVFASSAEELRDLFRSASKRRTAQDTNRNAASSRSHAFYRFYIVDCAPEGELAAGPRTGSGACIELVDLAGSESNKDSLFHDRERVEDAAKINSSLMALNDCIRKQSQGAAFVPFRADKLTQLLRPCFLKRSQQYKDVPSLLFIACLSPLASDVHQTGRTMAYAQQLATMKVRTRREAAALVKHRPAVGIKEWDPSRK